MTLHKSVARFNDATNNKLLLKLLEEIQRVSSLESLKALQLQISREEARQLKFLPIKVMTNHVIYVDKNGKLATCDIASLIAVNELLNELKTSRSELIYGDILRNLLVTAAGGLLKSYDTHTVLPTDSLSKTDINEVLLHLPALTKASKSRAHFGSTLVSDSGWGWTPIKNGYSGISRASVMPSAVHAVARNPAPSVCTAW